MNKDELIAEYEEDIRILKERIAQLEAKLNEARGRVHELEVALETAQDRIAQLEAQSEKRETALIQQVDIVIDLQQYTAELEAQLKKMPQCSHEWQETYYGTECKLCKLFYPSGSEPWSPK